MIPENTPFSTLIRDRRIELQLRQIDLAKVLHCTDTMVGKMEVGTRFPDIGSLPALAHALKIDLAKMTIAYLRKRCPVVYEALQYEFFDYDSEANRQLAKLPKDLRATVEGIIDKLVKEEHPVKRKA